jgi:hypothetical protein
MFGNAVCISSDGQTIAISSLSRLRICPEVEIVRFDTLSWSILGEVRVITYTAESGFGTTLSMDTTESAFAKASCTSLRPHRPCLRLGAAGACNGTCWGRRCTAALLMTSAAWARRWMTRGTSWRAAIYSVALNGNGTMLIMGCPHGSSHAAVGTGTAHVYAIKNKAWTALAATDLVSIVAVHAEP